MDKSSEMPWDIVFFLLMSAFLVASIGCLCGRALGDDDAKDAYAQGRCEVQCEQHQLLGIFEREGMPGEGTCYCMSPLPKIKPASERPVVVME